MQYQLSEVNMPQGAKNTRCQECGFTFGTHADACSNSENKLYAANGSAS